MNIKDRMHNILNVLSSHWLREKFIGLYQTIIGLLETGVGLLQRMMDTGDKSYAELEDIKGLLMTIVEQNEALLMEMKKRRWKR